MSDYLVNLARRSAGLAPMVRARVAQAVAPADSASEITLESDAARLPDVPTRSAMPIPLRESAARASTDMAYAPIAPPAAPAPVSSAPTAAVQRVPIAALAQSSLSNQAATSATVSATHVQPIPGAIVRPECTPTVAAIPQRVGPPQDQPVITRVVERVIESTAPTIALATHVHVAADAETNEVTQARDTRLDESSPIEPRSPALRDRAQAVAVGIEPAPRAEVTIPVMALRNDAAPTAERTVHVRIGAIEIHSGDSAQAPTAATPAPALAVASASASPAGGFDDFTALRSYAPWAW